MTLSCPRCGAAHPRSRGENPALLAGRMKRAGSSPLARGKRPGREASHASIGLIPARAGKTALGACRSTPTRAHPRSRGENVLEEIGGDVERGSSPLARGKRGNGRSRRHRGRLIPARAGKTALMRTQGQNPAAHPRSRGENLSSAGVMRSASGSSPLARGKHAGHLRPARRRRLIPARAGKTPAQ